MAASAAVKLAIAPQRLARFHRIANVIPISGTVCHRKRIAAGMSVNRNARPIDISAKTTDANRLTSSRCFSLAAGTINRWWMLLV